MKLIFICIKTQLMSLLKSRNYKKPVFINSFLNPLFVFMALGSVPAIGHSASLAWDGEQLSNAITTSSPRTQQSFMPPEAIRSQASTLGKVEVSYDHNGRAVLKSRLCLQDGSCVDMNGSILSTRAFAGQDVDRVKHSSSRLSVGSKLSRADMMHLALMSSENRAAHALGRSYPGGLPAFVRAMNDKARALGMRNTRFVEPTGLSSDNVASPRDLVKLLTATSQHARIQQYTTNDQYSVQPVRGRQLVFNNTNRLVKNANWDIQVSKTGFINEAGECLVMLTKIEDREVAIVLLNSSGRYSRIGDAVRIRDLVEKSNGLAML